MKHFCTFKLEPDAPQLRLVLNDVNIEHDVRCLFVKNSDVMFLSIVFYRSKSEVSCEDSGVQC